MVLRRNLVSALMQIWRRRLGSKSIQPQIVQLLWENGNGQSCSLVFVDLQIELAKRIKAFDLRVALKRRQALDGRPDEAVFERLSEREPIFYDGPGQGDSRRESADANNVTIAVSSSRYKVLR